ncbi:uncharacterized protein [Choristoneura fumiferana]|uniref:uncharacterized protein n=1 Tax=Choristoneura fumiferana TaxID=7141 RepID=UPI003D15E72E
MTSPLAVLTAFLLVLNEITLFTDVNYITCKFISSDIVFLLSNCLILRKINVYPLQKTFHPVNFFLEIPVSLLLLEFSFIYVWTSVQHCILHHADDILVFLSEQMGLDWFVCQMCSEKRDCSEAITVLTLKILSFALLFAVVLISKDSC